MQRWRGCLPIIGYFAELQEQHAVSEDCPGCMRRDRDRPDDAAEDVQVSTRAKVEPDEEGQSRGKQRRLFEPPCLRSNEARFELDLESSMNEPIGTSKLDPATLAFRMTAIREDLEASGCRSFEPGFDGYARDVRLWNGAVEHKAGLVAHCLSTTDVQTALRAAREHGVSISARGG